MEPTHGPGTFRTSGAVYDAFMGRYSHPLADLFADVADVRAGHVALDVGCGPGALTAVLVRRLGPGSVLACDPSPPFVSACAARCPGVEVRAGAAEALPFEDSSADRALAQLVLPFVADPGRAASEFRRILRPGGVAAACVWDSQDEMEMLRLFWEAALTVDPSAPDEARTLRFGRRGEIAELLAGAGFEHITETTLRVASVYVDFDELWSGFLAGIGPAGAYCVGLGEGQRAALRGEMMDRLGSPTASFSLSAVARCTSGRNPV